MTFIITGKDGYETVKEKLVGFGNLLKIETGRGNKTPRFRSLGV